MKRRNFIASASTVLAGGVFLGHEMIPAQDRAKRISANEKFTIGVIGCNGMGWSNTTSFLKLNDVDLLGICASIINVYFFSEK